MHCDLVVECPGYVSITEISPRARHAILTGNNDRCAPPPPCSLARITCSDYCRLMATGQCSFQFDSLPPVPHLRLETSLVRLHWMRHSSTPTITGLITASKSYWRPRRVDQMPSLGCLTHLTSSFLITLFESPGTIAAATPTRIDDLKQSKSFVTDPSPFSPLPSSYQPFPGSKSQDGQA